MPNTNERYLTVTWEDIKKSGLIPDHRLAQLQTQLNERIEPVFNAKHDGEVVESDDLQELFKPVLDAVVPPPEITERGEMN